MTYGLIGAIALIAIFLIVSYNRFIKLRNIVKEAFSTMDVVLKKRFDLIPNLVETVKGYSLHEKETLEGVIKARNQVFSATTDEEKLASESLLSQSLKNLFALSESYPDLKANENFLSLQETLENIETEIASSRKYYNGAVRIYNTALEVFPSNLIAKLFSFKKGPLFELEDVSEREAVKVSF